MYEQTIGLQWGGAGSGRASVGGLDRAGLQWGGWIGPG